MRIRTGKADTKPDAPAHTKGTRQGEAGPNEKQRGHRADGRSTAARSTGIDPHRHEPIDPSMPNLSPP